MSSRKGDSRVSALKMASLLIAWGLVALLAYLGGVSRFVNLSFRCQDLAQAWRDIDNGLISPKPGAFGGAYGLS